jgi:phasin family protein
MEIFIMATSTNTSEKTTANKFNDFKIPTIDTNALTDSYKKNLEILGLIKKMSAEVCTGITKLQTAFIKQLMADAGSVVEKSKKPSDAIARLSEVARDNVVRVINNGKQISDILTVANSDISAATTKRFKESIEEAKNIMNKK